MIISIILIIGVFYFWCEPSIEITKERRVLLFYDDLDCNRHYIHLFKL